MRQFALNFLFIFFLAEFTFAASCSGRITYSGMGPDGSFTTIGARVGPGMVRLCVEGNTFVSTTCNLDKAGIYIYDSSRSDGYAVINEKTPVGYCVSLNICDGCMDLKKVCGTNSGDITLSWSTVENGASLCSGPGTIAPYPSAPATDCISALPVCNGGTFPANASGEGFEEFMCAGVNGFSNGGCLTAQATGRPYIGGEHNSRWYRFVPQTSGTLTLNIKPSEDEDDYDFALWQSNNCNNLGTPLRCNYCDGSGTTGIGPAGTEPSVEVSLFCNNFSSTVNVTAGLTYYLLVNGFASPSDPTYKITFGGSAVLNCDIVCAAPTINSTITTATCGLPTGAINLSVGGGVLPYIFNWSNGATGQNITALTANTYSVTVTTASVPSCSTTASFNLTESSNTVVANISGNLTICPGGSTNLTVTGGETYAWSNGRSTAIININAIGIYTVTVTNAAGCISSSSIQVIQSMATSFISGASTLCTGGNTSLIAEGGGTYIWSNGPTTRVNVVTEPGNYTVTVTNNGCTNTAQTTVTVSNITASISGASTLCIGGNTTLTASGGGSYVWSNGTITANNVVNAATTYTVTVTNNGCISTNTIVLVNIPKVEVSVPGLIELELGDILTIIATVNKPLNEINQWNWTSGIKTFPDYTTTLIDTPQFSGKYRIRVIDINGCLDDDVVNVIVKKNVKLYIPNIFSPNKDGINDLFKIYSEDQKISKVSYLRVFDRWGNMMYEDKNFTINGSQKGWDGIFQAKLMNPAVFVYDIQVELKDGSTVKFTGDVTLTE